MSAPSDYRSQTPWQSTSIICKIFLLLKKFWKAFKALALLFKLLGMSHSLGSSMISQQPLCIWGILAKRKNLLYIFSPLQWHFMQIKWNNEWNWLNIMANRRILTVFCTSPKLGATIFFRSHIFFSALENLAVPRHCAYLFLKDEIALSTVQEASGKRTEKVGVLPLGNSQFGR